MNMHDRARTPSATDQADDTPPGRMASLLLAESEPAGAGEAGTGGPAPAADGSNAGYAGLTRKLTCDVNTGILSWRKESGLHGKKVGNLHSRGYLYVGVERKKYLVHRVVWWFAHGEWPQGIVDHINRNKLDNRIANLRIISDSLNKQNSLKARKGSASGLLGVAKERNKWLAYIQVDGVRKRLGVFCNPKDAHAAYIKAKEVMHPGYHKEPEYDVYLHMGIWHARRVLKNGSIVCGLGYDKQEAIEDLEANWGGQ